MKITPIKITATIFVLLFICSYFFNFNECKNGIHSHIDQAFQEHAIYWGDSIMAHKGLLNIGIYNSEEYKKKKSITMLSADDTLIISCRYFHPKSFYEYIKENNRKFFNFCR